MSRELVSQIQTLFNHVHVGELVFRPLARSDAFPLFQAAASTPEFNRYLLWPTPSTPEEVQTQVDKLIREGIMERSASFSLSDKDTGAWKGLCVYKAYREGIEMSSYLSPKEWATGTIVLSGKCMIQSLMTQFNLPVYVRVRPGNQSMLKICRYNQFFEEEGDSAVHPLEGQVPLQVFKLDPDRWPQFDGVQAY